MTDSNKPTLADMLMIMCDAITEADMWDPRAKGFYPESVSDIAVQIEADHGAIPFCESLAGLDPFQNAPRMLVVWCFGTTDWSARQTQADIDGALFRLASSGYAHTI